MFQRDYLVPNLAEIFWVAIHDGLPPQQPQFTQGGLSSFDLAGQDSFSTDEGVDENVWVG